VQKKGEYAACLKNFVHKFVEKIYKMGVLEGNGVPVLYIGRTVPKERFTCYQKLLVKLSEPEPRWGSSPTGT
jgi:hypothetical protein